MAAAGTLLLAGCANSELNARVSRMFPIRQMDAFFGYRHASPSAPPAYTPPQEDTAPARSSGYAPAYPPYSPDERQPM